MAPGNGCTSHGFVFQVLVFVPVQFQVIIVLYDEHLSADGASGIRLSNLIFEESGFTQGHQLVLASSSLRGWEV